MGAPVEIDTSLWRWTARHPEWHPGEFGAEVGSYALRTRGDALLIDPLLPEDEAEREAVLDLIDSMCDARRMGILITIPYHARSAEEIWTRVGDRLPTTIHGHAATAKRLRSRKAFKEIEPGKEMAGDAVGFEIGSPKRQETPIYLPSHAAIAFGDAVVGTADGLRMWAQKKLDNGHRRFYTDRFAPTLEPLLDLEVERVLVTHGPPMLKAGGAALADAIHGDPWYHRPL